MLYLFSQHQIFFFFENYFSIFFLIFFAIFLSCFLLGASYIFAVQKPDFNKMTIYECGFDPYEDSRNFFNIKFYIVAILFIIFDLETLLLFPWANNLSALNNFGFWLIFEFLFELIIGFIYIWLIGVLDW